MLREEKIKKKKILKKGSWEEPNRIMEDNIGFLQGIKLFKFTDKVSEFI